MAVIVGLALVPVGGAVGTAIALLILVAVDPGILASGQRVYLATFVRYGMAFGMVFAAPVTVLVLPAAYGLLRRRAALAAKRLGLAGALAGPLPVLAFSLMESRRTGRFNLLEPGLWFMFGLGAVAGLAVGLCFAHIMKRLRPSDWAF